MKNNKKVIIIVGIVVLVILLIGLVSIFKNGNKFTFNKSKTIEIKDKKGNISVTYENNGKNEYVDGTEKQIKNKESNYKLKFSVSDYTIDQAKKIKENATRNKNLKIEDIKFGNYDGFAVTNLKDANTIVYIYVKEDVVLKAKVYSIDYEKVKEQIKNGQKAEDIIYNLDEVQQILNTVQYNK